MEKLCRTEGDLDEDEEIWKSNSWREGTVDSLDEKNFKDTGRGTLERLQREIRILDDKNSAFEIEVKFLKESTDPLLIKSLIEENRRLKNDLYTGRTEAEEKTRKWGKSMLRATEEIKSLYEAEKLKLARKVEMLHQEIEKLKAPQIFTRKIEDFSSYEITTVDQIRETLRNLINDIEKQRIETRDPSVLAEYVESIKKQLITISDSINNLILTDKENNMGNLIVKPPRNPIREKCVLSNIGSPIQEKSNNLSPSSTCPYQIAPLALFDDSIQFARTIEYRSYYDSIPPSTFQAHNTTNKPKQNPAKPTSSSKVQIDLNIKLGKFRSLRDRAVLDYDQLLDKLKQTKLELAIAQETSAKKEMVLQCKLSDFTELLSSAYQDRDLPTALKGQIEKLIEKHSRLPINYKH